MTLEQALERAYRTRPDYLAALERIKAAEASRQAAIGETMPSVRINANYGDLGLSIPDSHYTYTVAGTVEIPIYQGGRARGRRLDAETDLRRRRTDADDLKGAIYYEVRTAMLDLQTGNEQLEVATRGRMLAASELAQARDRFAAGVAGNIEVVQAQAAVTLADDQYISALFTTSLAKGSLVRAVGIAEETTARFLEAFADARSTSIPLVCQPGAIPDRHWRRGDRDHRRRCLLLSDRRPRVHRRRAGRRARDADRRAGRRDGARPAVTDNQHVEAGAVLVTARSARLPDRGRQGAAPSSPTPKPRRSQPSDVPVTSAPRPGPCRPHRGRSNNPRRASTRHRRSSSSRGRVW